MFKAKLNREKILIHKLHDVNSNEIYQKQGLLHSIDEFPSVITVYTML